MDPKRLKSVPLFEGLSRKSLEQLGTWTDEVTIPEGKVLAQEGSFAYEFFAIEEGTAEVTRSGLHLSTLGPGDFFGEIALLEADRRTASVVATSEMKLIVMSRRDFRTMTDKMPRVAEHIRAKIRERLAGDRDR
jgi:CRP-like cAMP-binding protein